MKKYLLIFLFACGFYVFAGNMGAGRRSDKVNEIPSRLSDLAKPGDVILRRGRGAMSDLFRRCSVTDPRFSHAGLLHAENGCLLVYHLVAEGEGRNLIRKEPLRVFIQPENAAAFAIYRPLTNSFKTDSVAASWFRMGIVFDSSFDLATDDRMYCTEYVYKVLQRATGDKNFIPLKSIAGIQFVACDDISHSKNLRRIYEHDY